MRFVDDQLPHGFSERGGREPGFSCGPPLLLLPLAALSLPLNAEFGRPPPLRTPLFPIALDLKRDDAVRVFLSPCGRHFGGLILPTLYSHEPSPVCNLRSASR